MTAEAALDTARTRRLAQPARSGAATDRATGDPSAATCVALTGRRD
ncbi:hypothetical protein ACFY8N_23555 [Streptomyces collinus]